VESVESVIGLNAIYFDVGENEIRNMVP